MERGSYIAQRLAQAIFTVFIVVTLSFGLIRLVPGGPVEQLKAQLLQNQGGMTIDEINRLTQVYTNINPDKPIWQQYIDYMLSIAQLDFGRSMVFSEPVVNIVADALPWTLFVMTTSLILTFGISIILGALMAYQEGSRFDLTSSSVITVLNSVPYYVVGLLLLYYLAYDLGYFPTGGRVESDVPTGFNLSFVSSVLYHAALPIFSLVVTGLGWSLTMRANSIQVLGEDYLRVARLRGLPVSHIATRYVAPNAILPMYTGLMISIGFLFGGSVILEQVFTYPGMGYYLVEAISRRDYPLLMAGFIIITTAVVIGIFVADLTYGVIDPRAGSGQSREAFGGGGRSTLDTLKQRILSLLPWVDRSNAISDGSGYTRSRPMADQDSVFSIRSDDDISPESPYRRIIYESIIPSLKILLSDWRGRIGIVIVLLYVLMGTLGVIVIAPPYEGDYPRMAQPFQDMQYILGTDIQGQDIFAAIVHATPAMLKMILAGAVFSTVMATIVGTLSGYKGGQTDRMLMVISDIMMTIPGLPLIIVLAAILEPRNPFVIGILLTINAWAGLARSLRSQVLVIRQESYVEAARVMGVPTPAILSAEILPNVMPYILINFMNSARQVIFSSVGLYFLGVFPFSTLNWGVMMNTAQKNSALVFGSRFHWILAPMLTISLLSYGLILLSQSSDQLFNPRLRAKHVNADAEEDIEEGTEETSTASQISNI